MRPHYENEFTLKWTLCIVNWMLIIQHHEEILEIQCGFTSRNWGTNFDHHSAKLSRLLICGSAAAPWHYSEIKVTFPIWCTLSIDNWAPHSEMLLYLHHRNSMLFFHHTKSKTCWTENWWSSEIISNFWGEFFYVLERKKKFKIFLKIF